MLTSIRGITAASLTAGLLLSAAPALASDEVSEITSSEDSLVLAAVSEELIEADKAISGTVESDKAIVLAPAIARASQPVEAETANSFGDESGLTFSANVALTTDYRFRGITFTDNGVAIQGGFDVSHSSGFYVGTWGSNLDENTVGYGSIEVDVYGGWTGNLIEGLAADVGVIGYLYPDAGPGEFDYIEFYGSLTGTLGPASVTGGVAYAPNQDSLDFGGGQRDNFYLYGDVSVGIPSTPLTVKGHLGYTDGVLTYTADSKAVDYLIGVDIAAGPVTFTLAYTGVEGDVTGDPFGIFTDDGFFAMVSASF